TSICQLAIFTSALVFVTACASGPVPTQEIALSESAVAHAVSADAPELAPLEMRMARDKLDRARRAMDAQNYGLARSLAEESQVDAQLAETKARSSKAHEAAAQSQESARVLGEELDRKNR